VAGRHRFGGAGVADVAVPDAGGVATGVSVERGSTGVDRAGVDWTGVDGPGVGGTPEETSGEVDGSPSVVGASVSVVVVVVVVGVVVVGVGGRVWTAVRGAHV